MLDLTRNTFEDLAHDLFERIIDPCDRCLTAAGYRMNRNEIDDVVIVGGSTRIPAIREKLKDYFDKEQLVERCHVEEVVAAGAAVVAASAAGVDIGLTIESVSAYTYGINKQGKFVPMIEKYFYLPYEAKLNITTDTKDQTEKLVQVYESQGEVAEEKVAQCR